jgi:hypothetical protein
MSSVSAVSGNGEKRSTRLPGVKTDVKSNDAGITPTTLTGSPFNWIDLPTISRLDAKRFFHKASVRITAAGPPLLHSSELKVRPTCGSTPSRWKKFSVTGTAVKRSGSPAPVSL